MSFSYKTLSSNDISLTSYIANKQWNINNDTLYQNGITIYIGENLPINRTNPFDPINDSETSNEEYRRLIYAFEFSDNSCYVGLTGDIKRRKNQHLKVDEDSSVFIHMMKTQIYPKLIIKTDYIDVEDAIKMEEYILNDLYDIHIKNNTPLYISFHYLWWNDKNLNRFIFLSEQQKKNIYVATMLYL